MDDVITDGIGIVADDIKTFAEIDIFDHIIDHKGFSCKADGGEQSCFRIKDEKGSQNGCHIYQHQYGAYIHAGVLFHDHGNDIRTAAGCSDIE